MKNKKKTSTTKQNRLTEEKEGKTKQKKKKKKETKQWHRLARSLITVKRLIENFCIFTLGHLFYVCFIFMR